jgi:hypothetical protein
LPIRHPERLVDQFVYQVLAITAGISNQTGINHTR